MKKTLYVFAILIFFLTPSFILNAADDQQEFIKNNPDGQKYDFVRNYLSALSYLYKNETRKTKRDFSKYVGTQEEKIDQYVRELTRDNINIRTARNLMKQFFSINNPMMVKVTDIFYQVCDEQTKFNEEEIDIVKSGPAKSVTITPNNLVDANKMSVASLDNHLNLSNRRKESLQKLLEASILVGKVLVSSQADKEGDLVVLGINEDERKKLLFKIDEFNGERFEGNLREGQTYLEASIVSIREILEDYSWGTLDDLAKSDDSL